MSSRRLVSTRTEDSAVLAAFLGASSLAFFAGAGALFATGFGVAFVVGTGVGAGDGVETEAPASR